MFTYIPLREACLQRLPGAIMGKTAATSDTFLLPAKCGDWAAGGNIKIIDIKKKTLIVYACEDGD